MTTVILVIHIMIAAALVGIVLIQRSEGGALGIGGGGGGGGFMTARGTANLLTRVTAILAAAFFATSILLAVLASTGSQPSKLVVTPAGQPVQVNKGPAPGTPATAEQTPKATPPQQQPQTPPQPQPNVPQVPQSK